MQKTIILILILSLFTCRHKKISKIWEFPQKKGLSFFTYGVVPDNIPEANIINPPVWGAYLKNVEDKTCLYSHDDFFRSKEYGPTLALCVETTSENETLLKSALETLKELDETKLRPDGFLKHDGAEAHVYFSSLTEIINEITKTQSKLLFIGDNRIHTALEKRMDLSFETNHSISGSKEKRFETSFSLPYFSIYETDETYKLIFPPYDSWTPRSQFHYLVIEISNIHDFLSKFQTTFSNINAINETWKEKCSHGKLEISEVMGYASGSTKRFIEWRLPNENPICPENINLVIADKTNVINLDSPFIFPNSVKLLIEEDSPLQGFVVKDLNWSDIKSKKTLSLHNSDLTDTWELPNNIKFNWTLEEFSLKRNQTACEWSTRIFLNSKFCGDPGVEFAEAPTTPIPPDVPNPIPTQQICLPDNFILSELNAYGLHQETSIDKTGKFIELQFLGVNECKLTDLSLVIGDLAVPLFGTDLIIKPKSFLVISEGKHFIDLPNLIRRNLEFIQWQNSIRIQNPTNSKILWTGQQKEEYFISESMNGNISSMIFTSGFISHHAPTTSNHFKSMYRILHSMSPGEANTEWTNTASGEISEVLWAGAYKNSVSIPDEKFVEIKTKGEGTLELEIIASGKFSKYFFPVQKLDDYTVLSKKSFQCFPQIRSIPLEDLNLSSEFTEIQLKSFGNPINKFTYNSLKGEGKNQTTLKQRASAVHTGNNNIVRTSIQSMNVPIESDCRDQTYASPGRPNEFEPFLVDESPTIAGSGLFSLAASIFDMNLPYIVKIYSHLPLAEYSVPLEKINYTNFFKTVFNSLNPSGLSYQRLENYSDLKIYNKDGIFIEGVLANPMNAQNEWILLCNRSTTIKDISEYEIEDQDSVDQIDSYFKRKKTLLPLGVSAIDFSGNSTLLSPGQCGYLVDPDASTLNLRQIGISPSLVFTVRSTSTIGNGISSGEMIDLFKKVGQERIHIHSFGNRYSHAPFSIPVTTDEIILLSSDKRGESRYDYEVLKW